MNTIVVTSLYTQKATHIHTLEIWVYLKCVDIEQQIEIVAQVNIVW